MRKYDVVYILAEGAGAGELRMSLRSIEKNLTHGKVWIFGGCPDGIVPDEHVHHKQSGQTKWQKVRSSLIQICNDDRISKKFWLFNDDFYVLQKLEKTAPLHRGLIMDHIKRVEARHMNRSSEYTRQLRICDDQLHRAGCTTLDYAIHVPMLVDREMMLEALKMFPSCPMFRSLYGNYAKIGGDFFEAMDVKTTDPDYIIPDDAMFFSTSNKAFAGKVKAQLEERFPDPCKYEVEHGESVCEEILQFESVAGLSE